MITRPLIARSPGWHAPMQFFSDIQIFVYDREVKQFRTTNEGKLTANLVKFKATAKTILGIKQMHEGGQSFM